MPTRSGRHGQAFTWGGKLNMRNAAHIEDMRPLDEASNCPAARDYSRAYIHHLLRAGEYLAPMILSWANTHFYQDLMAAIRQSIGDGTFAELAARVREAYPSKADADEAGASASAE
jgi:queuine tRNA-ribosyltransferase